MEENYENKLYGKVEFLHERSKQTHDSLIIFSELITNYINILADFSKSIANIKNRTAKLIYEKDTSIYHLTHIFKLNLKAHIEEFKECAQHLNLAVIEPLVKSIDEKYIKEKELYSNYNKVKNIYNNAKINLEKSRKEFESNANICEKNILNLVQLKSYDMHSANDIPKIEERMNLSISNAKTFEDKYYLCIEEANKARENEINKQKELLKCYQDIDTDFYSKINKVIIFLLPMIKKMFGSVLQSLEGVEEACKKVNIKQDINKFMENNKSDLLPDKQIQFIPYYPEASVDLNKITGNDRKDLENLDINYNVILKLYENFRDIRKDLNMEEEKQKYRLRSLCSKIFKIGPGIEFKQEDKNELISFLNKKEYKSYFIITLSKQRTKGRYKRSETLLKGLSEILNYILDTSEKEKDYDAAKNCLILSQTFYYEKLKEKNKKKIYLFNYIKNNKWLKSLEFWEGLTNSTIQNEIKKSENINIKNKYIEDEAQKKSRVSNIAFSQVLSYCNSMIDLLINKEDILKFADIFIKKYEIEKSSDEVIKETIKNTPYPKYDDDEDEDEDKEKDIKRSRTITKKNEKKNSKNVMDRDSLNGKVEYPRNNSEERANQIMIDSFEKDINNSINKNEIKNENISNNDIIENKDDIKNKINSDKKEDKKEEPQNDNK